MTEQEQEQGGPPGAGQPRGAIRLVFSYDGEDVRFVSSQRVDKLVPQSDALEGYEEWQGAWYEVRDAGGTMLHRRVLHDPVRRDIEVFPEELGKPITRMPVPRPAGAFFLLVPDLDGADHLALMRGRSGPRGARAGATEIVRVPLPPGPEPDPGQQSARNAGPR